LVRPDASASIADHFGLAPNFLVFAALNLIGAALAFAILAAYPPAPAAPGPRAWRLHLGESHLRAAFGIGFCILFAFIGVFTYVNFVLVRPPFELGPMQLGLAYLVFAPSIVTTPLAGRTAARFGARPALWASLALAGLGLPLLLSPSLAAVLVGLALTAIGTFFAQAVATGFVGRAAAGDRAAASGLYLAADFGGGLAARRCSDASSTLRAGSSRRGRRRRARARRAAGGPAAIACRPRQGRASMKKLFAGRFVAMALSAGPAAAGA
jgi:hypothetical protein